MYSLTVTDFVMIAHSLAGEFFGPAQRLHGATLTVEAKLTTEALDEHGVVVDIGALREHLRAVLAPLDYQNLDEHPAFPPRGSTTERIAGHIGLTLGARLQGQVRGALEITVHESPVARVGYTCSL